MLLIGSAKSGTTSLHHYLGAHPEVTMATRRGRAGCEDNDAAGKEMSFFWRDDWRERMSWYQSHFANMSTAVRGEATPSYSAHPFHRGVAQRIYSVAPNARLLYIVRDPIERIVSHYIQQRADGDRRSFAERMRDYDKPDNSIVCPSRYAWQLDQYLTFFAASQLLVVDQHKLRHERRATLRRIFAFLGVAPDFWDPVFERESNTRADKYALTRGGERLFEGCIDPIGRRVAGARWPRLSSPIRRRLSQRVSERPVIERQLREKLVRMLRPEVERLRELTGEQFESWSL